MFAPLFDYVSVVTLLEIIQRSSDYLAKREVDSPRLQVEWMLSELLKLPRLQLYLNFEREMEDRELEILRDWIRRRGSREPLQHILGNAPFCGYEIRVTPEVLVPRPETEQLAEWGWKHLQALVEAGNPRPLAVDLGTGSGCVAVALALGCPACRVVATDISQPALEVARQNAQFHGVQDRIEFLNRRSIHGLESIAPVDRLISNPPYIPSGEIQNLQPEVRDHDPHIALDGGSDGLDIFREIANAGRPLLTEDGKLMLEFGEGQEEALTGLFESKGWRLVTIENDFSGRPRFLIAAK